MNIDASEDRALAEEYKVWKKNSPFLYDLVHTHALDWPSLTVQWLPDVSADSDRNVSIHKMVLGTHTSEGEPNHLMIAEVLLPLTGTEVEAKNYDDERKEVGGFGGTLNKVEVKVRINHDGDVHRARSMPQNQFMIATKSPSSQVLVFDYSRHDSTPMDSICRPQHRCLGHNAGGYGISWNPSVEGQLLSGSEDSTVCMWNLKGANSEVQAITVFRGHDSDVQDVDWSHQHSSLFASVGDDRKLLVWDVRQDGSTPSTSVTNAHDRDVNCVCFNPFNDYLLATGSADSAVALWDLRYTKRHLHLLQGHAEGTGIYQLGWAPFQETILASSGDDRRVNVWDISRIGREQSKEDAEDGPPELLFGHGGHTAKVSDFHWNKNEDWTIASVSEDNILQIWQPNEEIVGEDDDDSDGCEVEADDMEGEETNKELTASDGAVQIESCAQENIAVVSNAPPATTDNMESTDIMQKTGAVDKANDGSPRKRQKQG